MVIKKLSTSARHWLVLSWLVPGWLAICSLPTFAAATASIDRSTVGIDETFQLTLSVDETSMFDKPDISVLEKDFAILSQQKSSQSSWINGSKSATTEWLYQLAPKHTGIISIPAIDIDGEKTQPLTVKVTGTSNNNISGTNIKPVFMESVVDKKSLYVQEQLLLTLRINSSINLQNLQLQDLKIDNAFVVQVSNTSYQRSINNTQYITYEVVYAIFPQTSGELAIPPVEAAGINPGRSSFNSFFNSGTNMHLQSQPLSVSVNAIPAKVGNQLWLPAKNLNLSETWSADPENIQIGDSITRTITTTANGLSSEQLPTASMQADTHYKIYPDQPKTSDAKNNEGVVGERKDSITLVATQAGEVTLPAINVQWWDIAENTLKTETLPEVTIKIKGDGNTPASQAAAPDTQTAVTAVTPSTLSEAAQPAAGVASQTATSAPCNATNTAAGTTATETMAWQIATGISSLLALVFMLLFFSARKKTHAPATSTAMPKENTSLEVALHNLELACKANSITAIRLGILAWAKLAWPDARIHALSDIQLVCKDEAIKTWLNKIDACLYTGQQSQENWLEFYRLIAQKQAAMNKDKSDVLKPLYPV